MRTTKRVRRARLESYYLRYKKPLTVEHLREALHYDPTTGKMIWRANRLLKLIGKEAGTPYDSGLINIMVNGGLYKRYRLAWFYMTGEWPEGDIDHKDCDPANDRWDNLRLATRAQNEWNKPKRRNNTTGFKGVWYDARRRKFTAEITHNYKYQYLGSYDTPQEAHVAYARAAKQYRGEYARTA